VSSVVVWPEHLEQVTVGAKLMLSVEKLTLAVDIAMLTLGRGPIDGLSRNPSPLEAVTLIAAGYFRSDIRGHSSFCWSP